jgi:hypothetical protein
VSATEFETLSPEAKKQQLELLDMSTKCTCGRSPTGLCEGWHGLTTEEYMVKMKEYKEQRAKEALNEAKSEEND